MKEFKSIVGKLVPLSFRGFLLILLLSVEVQGQADTGTIVGLVLDSQGAVVPGVLIKLTNTRNSQVRTVVTNLDGNYVSSLLPVGEYRITAEARGFKRAVKPRIVLAINQIVRADFWLSVGNITEEVLVTTETPLIQHETAAVGTVIDNKKVVDLPLNGRDFLQLTLLVPGAVTAAEGSQLATQGGAINVNGSRDQSNNFLLDGIDNNDLGINQFVVSPSVDAIQEFQLQSSTYSAEFGRSGGAQINLAIKSGGNQFHGTAFEFFRNAVLDAKNFFDPPDRDIPQFQRNQFGGSLGGPLRPNRTFFFFNYEGTRIRQAITRLAHVPTLEERNGNFSLTDLNGDGVIDAGDSLINPFSGLPFVGNRIPPEDQDEIGAAISQFFPDPNRTELVPNFVSAPILRANLNQVNVRLDHQVSRADAFFGRYTYADEDRFNPFDPLVDPTNIPGYGSFTKNQGQSLVLNHTHLFSQTLIYEFRLGFNRLHAGIFQENQNRDVAGQLGIPGLSRNPRDFGFPTVIVIGFDQLGEATNLPQDRVAQTFQVVNTLSTLLGKHSIKLGADFRHYRVRLFLDALARGIFVFAPVFTGNPLGDLLLGLPTLTVNSVITEGDTKFRTTAYNFFIHDDIRASRNLALNIGLRYEYNRPPTDMNDRGSAFDFGTRSLKRLGTGNLPRAGIEPDRNNLAPRFGFAWKTFGNDETVLRGGYGIFYDAAILNGNFSLAFNPPFFTVKEFFTDFRVPLQNPLRLQDPFPEEALAAGELSVLTIDRNFRDGYMQQWNLTLQREILPNLAIDIGYVGSKGTKLLRLHNVNQPTPGTDPDVRARRPIPGFGDITVVESSASSTYHSLQLRGQKRFSHGHSFLVAYTWSKSIDDASALFRTKGDGNFAQDSNNLRAERGLSNFDARHRCSFSYIYELPLGRGRRFFTAANKLVDAVLGGWQLSGIAAIQSGQPFTPQLSFDNSGAGTSAEGGFTDRPTVIGDPNLIERGPELWFNPEAFAVPTPGSFGNAGRNILTGPSFNSVDLGMFKRLKIRESHTLELRTEVFNLFNHPNLNLPVRLVDQPTAGIISSAKASRQIQFALKYKF